VLKEYELEFIKLQTVVSDLKDPLFWLQKAIKISKQGNVEAAVDFYKQGLKYNPLNQNLLYNLACCYEKIRKYGIAIAWFKNGIDVYPRWTDALFGIGVTYFKIRKFNEALDYI